MSIDQRIRTALRAEPDDTPDLITLLEGWADVEARADRLRSRDRTRWVVGSAIVAAVLAVAAAVVWWPRVDEGPEPAPPVPSPSAPTSSATSQASPLEGTWSTGQVPAQGVVDHLAAFGQEQWSDVALQGTPVSATLVFRLKLQAGSVNITRAVDGGPPADQDLESYEITGSRVSFSPQGLSCSTVFDWEVQGDQLRFALVSDDCPDYQGAPNSALMRSLYTAFPFTRSDG